MITKVYAARDPAAFPPNQTLREHGGFYIVTTPDSLPGSFDIVANVDDTHFEILHNSVKTMTYDDMSDLLVWATQ